MTPTSLVHTLTKFAAVAFVAAAFGAAANAQSVIASDNASPANYPGGNWTTGSNGGSGFGSWAITSNSGGHYIGSAANQGSNSASINTDGVAFAVYADGFVNANRAFTFGPTGNAFSIELAHKWDNGARGLNLRAGGGEVFNFNIGSSGYSWTGNGSSGVVPWDGIRQNGVVIRITFTRTSTGFIYSFSSNQATNLNGQNGTITSTVPDEFQIYASNAGGGGADSDFFFNNLQITGIPTPTGNRTVTFNVDMSVQESLGNFNSNNGTVIVVGEFNGWSTTNGTIALTNSGNGIYSGNRTFSGAEGTTVQYKFYNASPNATITWEDAPNRILTLGAPDVA
ncbi:MAG: hypothetical protein KGR46_02345, partial [Verrucomicrobia bacterium]|nr:hypothetical protein [Verrucomicrobiota bacterium]